MKVVLLLFLIKQFSFACFGQKEQNQVIFDSIHVFTDTIETKGSDFILTHYHEVSQQFKNQMLMDSTDQIFVDSVNTYSRLKFSALGIGSFDVPTIPLTHIFYLKNQKLILGLSKIVASPYRLVLYNLDGNLLYKATLSSFELKVDYKEFAMLIKKSSAIRNCISQASIVKDGEYFYIELSNCLINAIGRDSIRSLSALTPSHYFPLMNHPSPPWNFKYLEYYNFYSDSDPIYDLISIGSVPYLLILNSDDGRRVNIPLRPDCQINREVIKR